MAYSQMYTRLGLLLGAYLHVVSGLVFPMLPDFHFDSSTNSPEDHYHLGEAMGAAYQQTIQKRVAGHDHFFRDFNTTTGAARVYSEFLETHRRLVPHLVQELEGIAAGSQVPFHKLFSMSLQEELSYFVPKLKHRTADHCSDYMLCDADHCVNGHNEDGDLVDGHFFTAFVRLGSSNFTVLNYAGDLLGGMAAFAFNAAGLAFSLNYVGPPSCTTKGLGRNFVSRLLLQAHTWEEAVQTIARKHAAGHNYQLMDFASRRIANLEAAQETYSCRKISSPFFHTNQYQTLSLPGQQVGNSSLHRLRRAAALPQPSTPEDVLRILGDQHDVAYPIFHDRQSHHAGDLSDWTLATVLFDLDRGTVSVMQGNPAKLEVQRVFSVPRPAITTLVL